MHPRRPNNSMPPGLIPHGAVLSHLSGNTGQAIAGLAATMRSTSLLAPDLQEVAAISAAKWWGCEFSLALHMRLARRAGISAAALDQIKTGVEPQFADPKADMVWAMATQVLVAGTVRKSLLQQANQYLSEAEIMEVIATVGCHTLNAMVHNGARRLTQVSDPDMGVQQDPIDLSAISPSLVEP